jgi:trimeric autotransporter adhesin
MKTTMNIINAALAVLALVWFGLSSTARAITPSPDGGYADSNTAEGTNALFNFTGVFPNNGPENTAIGFEALYHNTTGDHNTAVGAGALFSNTAGAGNTALGHDTLNRNTGSHNTATGGGALTSNTSGHDNSASGRHALTLNNSGSYNTADGEYALASSTSASQNIALGYGAGFRLTTGGNNIDIGNLGSVATEANSIRIGNPVTVVYPDGVTHAAQTKTYIAGLTTAVTGSTVVVNPTTHQVGMMPSSARFKEEIKPMNEASEAILALKPVRFRYKKDIDPDRTQQYGLVAEEVEKVNPNLVVDDKEGKPYSVRYDQVNAMLLNEFLKEHKAFIAAQDKVDKLEATVATLVATVKEQAAQIQKVSAQIELSKAAPQTVKNTD